MHLPGGLTVCRTLPGLSPTVLPRSECRCKVGRNTGWRFREQEQSTAVQMQLRATLVPTGPAGTGQEAATVGQEVEVLPRPPAPNGNVA